MAYVNEQKIQCIVIDEYHAKDVDTGDTLEIFDYSGCESLCHGQCEAVGCENATDTWVLTKGRQYPGTIHIIDGLVFVRIFDE